MQLQTVRLPDAQVDVVVVEEITDLFIDAGIHLDAVNVEGLTATQSCVSRKYYQRLNGFNSFSYLDVNGI